MVIGWQRLWKTYQKKDGFEINRGIDNILNSVKKELPIFRVCWSHGIERSLRTESGGAFGAAMKSSPMFIPPPSPGPLLAPDEPNPRTSAVVMSSIADRKLPDLKPELAPGPEKGFGIWLPAVKTWKRSWNVFAPRSAPREDPRIPELVKVSGRLLEKVLSPAERPNEVI